MEKGAFVHLMSQQIQESLEEFAAVIKELTQLAGEITRVEEEKAEAASQKQHRRMDGYIQREQAQILKLRGLEQKRIRLAKNLGWDGLTFRQILEKASPEQQELLNPLFIELEQQLKLLENSRKAAERIINVRVHELQTMIALREGSSYDNTGNVNAGTPVHTKMRDRYV